MKRRLVIVGLAVWLAACTDEDPEVCWGLCHGAQSTLVYETNPATKVELLVIVDPALVAAEATRFQALMDAFGELWFDLRVGVLPAGAPGDRWLPAAEVTSRCWVSGSETLFAPRTCGLARNFEGTLGAVASCLAGAGALAASEPLETMRRVVSRTLARPADRAGLWLVIVSGRDDDSAFPVTEYAQWLSALAEERRGGVLLSVVAPPAAPRFEQLVEAFRESVLTRTDGDWSRSTLAYVRPRFSSLLCLPERLLDTAASEPGIQPECVISERAPGAEEQVFPRCGAGLPCHDLRPAQECGDSGVRVHLQRADCIPVANTVFKITCSVER